VAALPPVILHTNAPAAALAAFRALHPDLRVEVCDSYEGLPELVDRTGAEVVYSVRFAGSVRASARCAGRKSYGPVGLGRGPRELTTSDHG
jgi:hypothetical protein